MSKFKIVPYGKQWWVLYERRFLTWKYVELSSDIDELKAVIAHRSKPAIYID